MGVVLVEIYPYHPNTLTGWGVLMLLSLPIMLLGESLGEKILEAPFVAKLPRSLRILYAVFVLGSAIIAMMFAFPLLDPYLIKWGTP